MRIFVSYRKPYDDIANIKRKDMKRTFLNNMGQRTTLLTMATAEKKTKKNAPARKNSIANAHCTHLPLPANPQANPKAKSKVCNFQRFITLSVTNEITVYESYISNLNINR